MWCQEKHSTACITFHQIFFLRVFISIGWYPSLVSSPPIIFAEKRSLARRGQQEGCYVSSNVQRRFRSAAKYTKMLPLLLKESATTWWHYSSSVVNLSIRKQILLLTGTKSIKTELTMPYIKRWIEEDIQANYFFEIVHIFISISIDFSPANSWNFFILGKYTVLMLCK